ncbi:hypothetical protein BZA70DRAFT_21648 [Myxozyma melibiosi]|uniref:Uncharacterized protein n=1 Tax=Myxozyma melibiosi TaxID=54550 RepID=A0ABR1FCX1_9ASCO
MTPWHFSISADSTPLITSCLSLTCRLAHCRHFPSCRSLSVASVGLLFNLHTGKLAPLLFPPFLFALALLLFALAFSLFSDQALFHITPFIPPIHAKPFRYLRLFVGSYHDYVTISAFTSWFVVSFWRNVSCPFNFKLSLRSTDQ